MSNFNQIANSWDTEERTILNKYYATVIKTYITNIYPKKILELGCGTGLLGSNFVNDSNLLIGVDTSEGMLEVFKQKFCDNKKIRAILLNLEESNLPETNFDLIISSMAFHHLKNPEDMIIKLKKMLSPDGVLAIIDLDQEDGTFHPNPVSMGVFHNGFSKDTTISWAIKANFKNYHREIIHTLIKNQHDYPIFLLILINS
jgi:ubiquinone/menaquinone biosynthesis C-methylase UbiE